MLDIDLIETYKAQQMKHFLEYWMKICPDHTMSIRDGLLHNGSALVINIPASFAKKIRFNSPISEIKVKNVYHDADQANRERMLEVQIEHDELRANADKIRDYQE